MIYSLFWLQGLFKPKQNMAVERNYTFRIVLIICNNEHSRCGNYVQWICISIEWYSSKPPLMITALHVRHTTAAYKTCQPNATLPRPINYLLGIINIGDPWEQFSVFQSARNQTHAVHRTFPSVKSSHTFSLPVWSPIKWKYVQEFAYRSLS